jgi:hypothetical protein
MIRDYRDRIQVYAGCGRQTVMQVGFLALIPAGLGR